MTIGPSTTQTPYLVASEPNVRFVALLSAGDSVAGATNPDGTAWRFVGVPDGVGAFDNRDGTLTVLVNHELTSGQGIVRDHGATGAFVSRLTLDKATLAVTAAEDLIKTVWQDFDGDGHYTIAPTAFYGFCSADLAPQSAFRDLATGLGTSARLYLTGEEGGTGRAFAAVATGPHAGRAYELPALGNVAFENLLASPNSGTKTVVIGNEDLRGGPVYVYVGDKQATGTEVDRAGLTNGKLYGVVAEGIGSDVDNEYALAGAVPLSGNFTLGEIVGAKTMNGGQIEAAAGVAGVSGWWRPEDGAWDTLDPNRYYFATTASFDGPSRLWALDFVDIHDPTLGGTFTALLDGTEGQKTLDNLTVTADGKVILQEDPGGNARLAKVWIYDPATDSLDELAQHDPARFGGASPPFGTGEESSGVVDVTPLLGNAHTQAFLLTVQPHNLFGPTLDDYLEMREGGQLVAMFVDRPRSGGAGNDAVNGGYTDDLLHGRDGDDTMRGGSGADTLIGGSGNDIIEGGAGNDVLWDNAGANLVAGGDGADSLRGGAGDDTIIGGAGADSILAGGGADAIRYGSAAEGGDLVTGFARGTDRIEVSAAGFGGGLVDGLGLTAAQFTRSNATIATGDAGQFIWETDARTLWWDADGIGGTDAVAVTRFGDPWGLFHAADIVVVA